MTDRGVSVTVNYVIGLAVATLLVTGLLYATGDIVGDRADSTTRAELQVVGQHVVADLMTADRLVQSGADTVVVVVDGTATVTGGDYTVSLNATSQEVVLRTADASVTVRIPFDTATSVASSTARGGEAEIVLTGADELEVASS